MAYKKIVNPDDQRIGLNVRRIRNLRGVSQEKIGDILGVTFQQVQKYEKGTNRISGSRLAQLCRALNCTYDDFFAGIDIKSGNGTKAVIDPTRIMSESKLGLEMAAHFMQLPPNLQRSLTGLCVEMTERNK